MLLPLMMIMLLDMLLLVSSMQNFLKQLHPISAKGPGLVRVPAEGRGPAEGTPLDLLLPHHILWLAAKHGPALPGQMCACLTEAVTAQRLSRYSNTGDVARQPVIIR